MECHYVYAVKNGSLKSNDGNVNDDIRVSYSFSAHKDKPVLKIATDLKDNIELHLKLKAKVESLDNDINLRNKEDFVKLEQEFNKSLQEDITKFISFLQEKKTDILGINYKHFLKTKENDNDYFSKTKVNVDVKININKPGLTVRRVTNE